VTQLAREGVWVSNLEYTIEAKSHVISESYDHNLDDVISSLGRVMEDNEKKAIKE
jgi:hypothetical protein